MVSPLLADVHMVARAESHVRVNDSCNCCVPWLNRSVVVMDLPTTEHFERRGSHTVHTVTTTTRESFRESN